MTIFSFDPVAVMGSIPAGIVITEGRERGGQIRFVNSAYTELTGYALEEMLGRDLEVAQGPDTSLDAITAIGEALTAGAAIHIEVLTYRKSGQPFWLELRVSPQHDRAGEITGFVGIFTDITDRRRREAERSELEARLASVVENMPGYVFQRVVRADGEVGVTYFSPSFARLVGFEPGSEVPVAALWDRVHPDDREMLRQSIARSAADSAPLSIEFRLVAVDGRERWIRTQSSPRHAANGDVVWDGIGIDITAERDAANRLSYLAYHDPLTGLPNRLLLEASIARALGARSAGDDRLLLFVVDIDSFEDLNNAFGHAAADIVLRSLAKRIADFAESHAAYAARIGGDEFGIFYQSPATDTQLSGIAGELNQLLAKPLTVGDTEIVVDASIGVLAHAVVQPAQALEGAAIVSEMMRRATLALVLARRGGPGSHRIYAPEDDDRQRNQVTLRQSLRRAITERQFQLHYHPFVDLASGEIIGAEALVRWHHPELGLQRPDHFIPLAESSGLIVPLGAWIAEEAMRQVREWEARGIVVPRIAINVSGVQLRDPGFVRDIERAVARTGVRPEQFELELTEGFMIEASTNVVTTLVALKRMGFSLAVDDFGTGHASFQYLRDFPVDKIKIDQMFVRKMVLDSSDASIIRAIIALARSMGLEVVAEGIETPVQHGFLRDEGCRVGQGYLFSLPLGAEDFAYLLAEHVRLPTSSFPPPVHISSQKVSADDHGS